MNEPKASKSKARNNIRISLLLLILPVLYLGVWVSISADESLTYFEQVQLLMSYFPESIRNPFGITLTFFGMSFSAASFCFYGYLKSEQKTAQISQVVLCCIATLLTVWFGMTLL